MSQNGGRMSNAVRSRSDAGKSTVPQALPRHRPILNASNFWHPCPLAGGAGFPGHPIIGKPVTREGYMDMDARCRNTRSEEHTSELQSQSNLVCRLLLEK